ncbi:MAG: hypothetical protein V2I67_13180 [Thermoanaerobaculales bacterium]|jgi:hypothetical protein|nr:hypothetical protein [Thermoanaerobaculales bacterium]
MYRRIAMGTVLLTMVAAAPVYAAFGASDLIYLPVVAHTPGAVGSNWATDLYITNMDDVSVDVAMVYLPSGLVNNSGLFSTRDYWLGGREDDSFGRLNENLADIPPGGTVVLRDVLAEYWLDILGANGIGAMVVAGYEADTLEDDGSRVNRNITINARIYNVDVQWVEDDDNPGEFIEEPAQYGQNIPGVPWYNLADGGAVSEDYDLSYEVLTGGEEGGALRFNVGVVNASDPLTTLTVQIQPFQANGEPFLDADEIEIVSVITMPPGSHIQLFRPFRDDWGLEDTEGATVRVSILGWTSSSADPRPMMTSYGSVVVNNTNDPTTVLPSFGDSYNVECMWGGGTEGVKSTVSPRARPIEIPSQH